jgi:hypothetical protein
MTMDNIRIVANPETNLFRIEIRIKRKVYRTEHIFPSEAMSRIIAKQFEKAIIYSTGKTDILKDAEVI